MVEKESYPVFRGSGRNRLEGQSSLLLSIDERLRRATGVLNGGPSTIPVPASCHTHNAKVPVASGTETVTVTSLAIQVFPVSESTRRAIFKGCLETPGLQLVSAFLLGAGGTSWREFGVIKVLAVDDKGVVLC